MVRMLTQVGRCICWAGERGSGRGREREREERPMMMGEVVMVLVLLLEVAARPLCWTQTRSFHNPGSHALSRISNPTTTTTSSSMRN